MGEPRFVIGDLVAVAGRSLAMLVVDVDDEARIVTCGVLVHTLQDQHVREFTYRPSALRLLRASPLRV